MNAIDGLCYETGQPLGDRQVPSWPELGRQIIASASDAAACEKQGGRLDRGACPRERAFGVCERPADFREITYADGGLLRTAADAAFACKNQLPPGEWAAAEGEASTATRRPPAAGRVRVSCAYAGNVECRDYSRAGTGWLAGGCNSPGDVFSASPCPVADLLGSCVWPDGMTERFYAAGAKDRALRAKARKAKCESQEGLDNFPTGVWVGAD